MRDMNPAPRLKDPNRVNKVMVVRAFVSAGLWGSVPDTYQDATRDLNVAISLASYAGMYVTLEGPQVWRTQSGRLGSYRLWSCTIPPCRGRVCRVFDARTPAKAVCAALLDHLDHPEAD